MVMNEGQFILFRIQDQMFGLDIGRVREILEFTRVTPIPLVPDFIEGLLNLRGGIVPVIDVARRFGWDKSHKTQMTCIIVTEIEYENLKLNIGLMVDAVEEVVYLSGPNLEDSPNFGTKVRADFVANVGKVNGEFILLLDISKLLDIEEIQNIRESMEQSESQITGAKNGMG